MLKLRDLEPVDADYVTSGPNANEMTQTINKPADVVFRALEDGPAWKEWLGMNVEWTSPEPFGVGTTRTVTGNGQTIEEYFLEWEDGKRMRFRFDRATLPVSAFAEDWSVRSTGDDTCEVSWKYAYEWGGPLPGVLGKGFDKFFEFNGKRSLRKLAEFMENTDRFDQN